MTPYIHRVQYYETDKMGVVHHSNYIRWMEESRVDLLEQLGWPFERMEAEGLVCPVKGVRANYTSPSRFPDQIVITPTVKSFDGVTLVMRYTMIRQGTDSIVCTAESDHVFLNAAGRFIRMKRDYPEFYQKLTDLAEEK